MWDQVIRDLFLSYFLASVFQDQLLIGTLMFCANHRKMFRIYFPFRALSFVRTDKKALQTYSPFSKMPLKITMHLPSPGISLILELSAFYPWSFAQINSFLIQLSLILFHAQTESWLCNVSFFPLQIGLFNKICRVAKILASPKFPNQKPPNHQHTSVWSLRFWPISSQNKDTVLPIFAFT